MSLIHTTPSAGSLFQLPGLLPVPQMCQAPSLRATVQAMLSAQHSLLLLLHRVNPNSNFPFSAWLLIFLRVRHSSPLRLDQDLGYPLSWCQAILFYNIKFIIEIKWASSYLMTFIPARLKAPCLQGLDYPHGYIPDTVF